MEDKTKQQLAAELYPLNDTPFRNDQTRAKDELQVKRRSAFIAGFDAAMQFKFDKVYDEKKDILFEIGASNYCLESGDNLYNQSDVFAAMDMWCDQQTATLKADLSDEIDSHKTTKILFESAALKNLELTSENERLREALDLILLSGRAGPFSEIARAALNKTENC